MKIDWNYEFEKFMAKQEDYQGLPIWDRYLANVNCCVGGHFPRAEWFFISDAFLWSGSPEGNPFWGSINEKWRKETVKINKRAK